MGLIDWNDPDKCLKFIRNFPKNIKYVKNPTLEMATIVLNQDITLLELFQNQSYEICRYALRLNPLSIVFIKNKTKDLVYYAFNQDYKIAEYINIDEYPDLKIEYLKRKLEDV